MKILYLGYWPAGDGLTQSVIVPRLKILSGFAEVDEIFFCSVERQRGEPLHLNLPKVSQLFFLSKEKSNVLLTKFSDFTGLYSLLNKLIRQWEISLIICNSPLAGIIGYHLCKKSKIPFIVECFEPHASYMRESGAWKTWDPRYWILTYYEWRQKRDAFILATVSEKYTQKLLKENVHDGKILKVPNCIPLYEFKFNNERRSDKRSKLGIGKEDIVGIYVGKFGDIYYDKEAFDLFAAAFNFFGKNFWLIILSSETQSTIVGKLRERNIMSENIHVALVHHEMVPDFLSASDFAFSTIRPSPSRIYCCPVKNGEYWANGLPILLEDGIGDDSDIIRNEGGGILLDPRDSDSAFEQLSSWMIKGRSALNKEIFPIAFKYRRMEFLSDYYQKVFDRRRFLNLD